VGFDDSPASRVALEWALRDAGGRHCDVLLVHAAKTFPPIAPGPGGYVAYPSEITAETGKAVLQAGALFGGQARAGGDHHDPARRG
jgi:nucleotide-binding universal stress UspA family protein